MSSHFALRTLVTRSRQLGTTGNGGSARSGDNEYISRGCYPVYKPVFTTVLQPELSPAFLSFIQSIFRSILNLVIGILRVLIRATRFKRHD